MSTNKTKNYQLNQWEPGDQVRRVEFNEDNKKLDDALGALAGTVAEHGAAIAGLGNCQIYHGTYVGSGALSHSHTFPGKPLAVFIAGPRFQLIAQWQNPHAFTAEGEHLWGADAAWSGTRLTLSYSGTLGGGDFKIGNEQGSTYYIVALMAA